ncbi:MAG: DUF559 domain-containing protein [Candidatus Woesearchaeota archaeon]
MEYYCNECGNDITKSEFTYSKKNYNKALCRKCQTQSEEKATPLAKKLYTALKKRGVPAELEKYDGYKHIDIAIPIAKVNIEVDGAHHNYDPKHALADLKRPYYSFKKGYLTLRIPNSLLRNHFEETVDYLVEFLNKSVEQLEEDDDFFKGFRL